MADISRAPWTVQEIAGLVQRQRRLDLHPYTCPNRGSPFHGDPGVLCPGQQGWHCHGCDYTQDWAHRIDTKGGPE